MYIKKTKTKMDPLPLANSETPKDLEDHERQLKGMMLDFFLQ